MRELWFWQSWEAYPRRLLKILLFFLISSIVYFIYNYFFGVFNIIHWETITKLDQVQSIIHSFSVANIEFTIPLKNYVIFEYYNGSDLTINPLFAYIYLIILTIMINLIMTVLPDFQKFWFYVGMGGFIGFAVLLNVDQIRLFGQDDKTALIMLLGGYLSLGYFFKEIKQHVSLFNRFISFCLLSVVLGLIYYFYAEVEYPFLFIANYGIYGPVLVSILFILSVAHEIIYGFLYLSLKDVSAKSKNTLLHFVIISLIYLIYLLLTYLSYTSQVDWGLVYLNPFIILVATVLIGIWGFRKREELYTEIFTYKPVGFTIYLSFGIITLAVISYVFSMGNDPFVEVFEDTIIFSQLGFGILFFVYVLSNFSMLIQRNYQVAKIVYRSRVFPFFVFRMGGLFIFGYIFYSSGFYPYYQALAGYYNGVGDVYMLDKDYGLAHQYYNEASLYEHQNHRSNYGIATLARKQLDRMDELYFFENSLLKKPTDFAYINLANAFLRDKKYFNGLFRLRDGEATFPQSVHIKNNLGHFYSRTDIVDSAFYYYNISYNNARNKSIPASNILALLTKAEINLPVDSILDAYKIKGNLNGITNQLAFQHRNLNREVLKRVPDIENVNQQEDFALAFNIGLNKLQSNDTAYFLNFLKLADLSQNNFYLNRAAVLRALNLYFNNQVNQAFEQLILIGENLENYQDYFSLLGKLALEKESPGFAAVCINKTDFVTNDENKFNLGFSYLELGKKNIALELFEELIESEDSGLANLSGQYAEIAKSNSLQTIDQFDDEYKYLLLRYNYKTIQPDSLLSYSNLIRNPMLNQLVKMDLAFFLISNDQTEEAITLFNDITQNDYPVLEEKYYRLALRLASLDNSIVLDDSFHIVPESNNPLYLDYTLFEVSRNSEKYSPEQLDKMYVILGSWSPFHELGVLSATANYAKKQETEIYAYNLLFNALRYNGSSLLLNKKYIELSVDIGMNENAVEGLLQLKNLTTESEYNRFRKEILTRIEQKEERFRKMGF